MTSFLAKQRLDFSGISQTFKLKHIKKLIAKKKILRHYYNRFGYYSRRFSGRRRVRLNKFFFFRRRTLHHHWRSNLLLNLTFFLKHYRRTYLSYNFLKRKSILLAANFYRHQCARLKKFFLFKPSYYVSLCSWLLLLLKQRVATALSSHYPAVSNFLFYASSFNVRHRFRLSFLKRIYYRKLRSRSTRKKLFSTALVKRHRRVIKSLFTVLSSLDLKKVFFIMLRSSKNNTLISVFDFLGNLLYWKTSKTVGMPGKKKGTKMAAEFLAYHLTRYLRSRKFYNHKFIFTLFGLHRHFKVVFRFIKRNIRKKSIVAMLSKSKTPHGGCFLKKKKHKGRKKHHRRASLYY